MYAEIDVVIVSYNSADHLRACVAPLASAKHIHPIVVDNDSSDRSLETIADLAVSAIAQPGNFGFAHGCNAGWRAGSSPYVLFLNPDATIDHASARRLAQVLEDHPRAGIAAPKILEPDGSLGAYSLRRFPRLRSTFARRLATI